MRLFESNKTPGDMDGSSTRGVGRTRNLFLNSLVVSSSPTSSTTQSPPTGEILLEKRARCSRAKRLPKVATEMALNVLAYNIKRVMAIIGVFGARSICSLVRLVRANNMRRPTRRASLPAPIRPECAPGSSAAVA